MTFSDEATSRPVPGHGERMATRVAFFVVGVGYSMWAALVPYAKVRLGLDEATLGLLLLCIGLGSLLAMPFTGPLTGRFGCRRLLFVSLPATLVALPLWRCSNRRGLWPPACSSSGLPWVWRMWP